MQQKVRKQVASHLAKKLLASHSTGSILSEHTNTFPAGLFGHGFNIYFSPPLNGYNNRLTVHVGTIAKSLTVCFTEAFSLACLTSKSVPVDYKYPHLAWTFVSFLVL